MPAYVNIPTGSPRSYIQTAINGMTAGGTMHFEAGEYTIDTALSLLPNIRFVGDGMRASVFKLTAGSATPFEAVNLSNISFENLGFVYEGGTFSYIVRGTTTSGNHGNIVVKNCRFSNFNASSRFCIDFKDVNDCRVDGCQFENVWCGVSIRAGTKDVYRNTCFNCDFKNFEYAGVYATLVSPYCTFGTSVIGCRASKTNVVASGGLANPILFNGPRATPIVAWHMDVLIANNVIIGPGAAYSEGTVSTSDQFYLSNLNGGVVAGNIAAQGGANGMLIWASKKVAICANQCDKNYANGILGTGISNCAMTGNVCTNNGSSASSEDAGIALNPDMGVDLATSNNLLVGNLCTDDQTTKLQNYGIFTFLSAGSGASVSNTTAGANRVTGNVTAGEEVIDQSINDFGSDGLYGSLAQDPQFEVYDAEITIPASTSIPSAGYSLGYAIPAGTVLRSVQAIIRKPTASVFTSGSTGTAFSIGYDSSHAAEYGTSTGKVWNSKITHRSVALNASAVPLLLFPVGGTLTIGTSALVLRLKVTYERAVDPLPIYT